MPRLTELFHSKWLKAEDLNNGAGGYRRVNVTIARVVVEEIGGERKGVVYFRGKEKGLVLNRTNADFLQEYCRSDDTDAWTGVTVELWVDRTKNPRGQTVPGLRVAAPRHDPPAFGQRAQAPRPPAQAPPSRPMAPDPRGWDEAPRGEEPTRAGGWREAAPRPAPAPRQPADDFAGADGYSRSDDFREPPASLAGGDREPGSDDDIPF